MKGVRERLEEDLHRSLSRLRQIDGAVALEELPGPIGVSEDGFDDIEANELREIGFATRELLVERVQRLRAALERLREGEYGICVECGESIAPARLRVMPEVQTCVRCQDRLERLGRRLESASVEFGTDEE